MKSHPKPLNVHPIANRQDQHDPGFPGPLQERNEMKKTTKPAVSASKPPTQYSELENSEKTKTKLSDAMARLKAANDTVNATFGAADAYLEKLGLEFGAFVGVYSRQIAPEHFGQAESEYPADIVDEAYLAYERVGDRFRITVHKERSTVVDEEISTSFTVLPNVPWDNVSQQEKIFALGKLPDLFEALARAVEFRAEWAEKESATVNASLSRVS